MADNTTQTSSDTLATDELVTLNGSASTIVKAQRVKIGYGDDGIFRDVSANFPLPIINPDISATGTITATDAVVAAPAGAGALVSGASTTGSYFAAPCPGGDSAWNVQVTGLTSGTLYFEESLDSTNGVNGNWIAVNGRQSGIVNTVVGFSTTTNGHFRGNTSGALYFRVRAAGALTGTPAIVVRMSAGVGAIFLNSSTPAGTNQIGTIGEQRASTLAVTATAAAATIATASLPAAGAGLFHYITSIQISLYSSVARTGAAAPWVVTTTNLPGSLAWTFSTAGAVGANETQTLTPTTPLKASAANTITTVAGPAATGGIWRITVTYFTAA